MMKKKQVYYSYMLRLWQEDRKNAVWRISLENVQTGEQKGFAGFHELFDFLSSQVEKQSQLNLDQISREEDVDE